MVILIAIYIAFQVITNQGTRETFWFITGISPSGIVFKGLLTTVTVSVIGYFSSLIIGLILGLMRSSSNIIAYNIASFYVEIVRGVPLIVLLLFFAFAITPLIIEALNVLGIPLQTRDVPLVMRAVIALAIAYGAFTAEIFRGGIQSIQKGQHEASKALGLGRLNTMLYVIMPQTIRRILPALGNEFVAIVKDSSLVAVVGVQDLTQLTRLYYNANFKYLESLLILSYIYLIIVILLARLVQALERKLKEAPI